MDLIKENKNIRVVMREWPILGEASVFAAKASLAADNQGKYEEFHKELMNNRGRINEKSVMETAKKIGINIKKLKGDMNSQLVLIHLQGSNNLSKILGINGTPAFVFGDQVVPGAIDLKSMRTLVKKIEKLQ
jgi:protein-disulfide isomerase